jgi:hypothetical protein
MARKLGLSSVVLVLLTAPLPVSAQEPEGTVPEPDAKAECAAAYELSQEKRKTGELIVARDQLKLCIRDACPTFVRNECTEWLAEVEASLPTVVLAARRGDQDLDEVRVTMDGHPIADRLTGTAIPLDPGTHVFRFELEGSPPIEQRVLVRVGEKNRRVEASFGVNETAENAPSATAEADADVRTKGLDKRTVSYALAGLGAAALGSFAFFALTGKSDENDLRDRCSPNCPESDVDSVRTKYLVADISLGVGIASLGAATWFFIASTKERRETTRPVRPPVRVGLQPVRGGAFVGLTRHF